MILKQIFICIKDKDAKTLKIGELLYHFIIYQHHGSILATTFVKQFHHFYSFLLNDFASFQILTAEF